MADETIIERIRNLLAKAASTTSEHEAANCAALAQKLLEKHNLDMAAIGTKQDEDDFVSEHQTEKYGDPWRRALAMATARFYYCDMYSQDWFDREGYDNAIRKAVAEGKPHPYDTRRFLRPGFVFIGAKHNVAVARSMTTYLIDTTVRLAKEYSPERRERIGFERGCGERLASRLRTLAAEARAREMQAKRAAERKGETLPALYDDADARIKAHKATLDLHSFGRGSSFNGHSAAGAAAAENVSLATQLDTAAGKQGTLLAGPKS